MKTPQLNNPPDWWQHSKSAWIDLQRFFNSEQILLQDNWLELSEGLSNHNYRVTFLQHQYFVQIIDQNNRSLLPQFGQIEIFDNSLICQSISNWLIACLKKTEHVRIFDWFENSPVKSSSFDQPDFFDSLTEFLVKLHGIALSPVNPSLGGHYFDIHFHLTEYRKLALQKSPIYAKHIESLFCLSSQFASSFEAKAICHNDLGLSNLLWNGANSQLKIIDWEYACFSDPVMDIAGLVISCNLNHQQQQKLIACYQQKAREPLNFDRLESMKKLCHILSQLWHYASRSD